MFDPKIKVGSVVLTVFNPKSPLQYSAEAYDKIGLVCSFSYSADEVFINKLVVIKLLNDEKHLEKCHTRHLNFYPSEVVYIGELE